MTSSRLLLVLAAFSGLLFTGCPTDGNRGSFNYLRSPVTFRLDPVPDNHPFCADGIRPGSMDQATCEATPKYRLRWDRPEDTTGFTEYRIYLDTLPPDAPELSWDEVRKQRSLASYVMAGRPAPSDSIVFFLTTTPQAKPQEIQRDAPRLVALDTTGRADAEGRLVFAITTVYNQTGLDGQPRYTYAITNDRFEPNPLLPSLTPKARTLDIAWSRPLDRTDFFDPKADTGVIAGYVLSIRRGGTRTPSDSFAPTVTYRVGGVDRTAAVTFNNFNVGRIPGRRFWLPDSQRVFDRTGNDPRDSLHVTVSGLSPLDTLDIGLWAIDSARNGNRNDSTLLKTIFLTDTTQPTKPVLSLVAGSVTRNRFVYTFTASRDLVESGGGLVPASTPNANILEYRITRRRIAGPAGGADVVDSVLEVRASNRENLVFTDTARYLPPGATYRVYVQAVDSTGYLSERDSLEVSTIATEFAGADSGATCPPGFIAMPAGSFYLGETAANVPGGADEGGPGSGLRAIKSFCIEPREHLASGGGFQNRVTWQQAHDICRDLSPADSTHLCTEAEWERACEGIEEPPLLYGIQAERQDPGGVRYTCNIGTGDSAMAMSPALRDPSCISYDGAFDMSGNLAEWVMDPYTANGYPGPASDTLIPGRPHTTPTAGARRVFRGNHYLNPGYTPAVLLRAARCSNRDYATQLRPQPWPGCVDANRSQIAVLYSDQSKLPRCFPLPDSLASLPITSLAPGRDTNQILILVQGRSDPVSYFMPIDTVYRGQKPISARLTARTLAVVTFENAQTNETVVDTLDASELLNRTEAERAVVFARDAAPPWSVRKKQDGTFDIQYLYAHVRSGTVPARAYYSNKVLGFRCCSNVRRP